MTWCVSKGYAQVCLCGGVHVCVGGGGGVSTLYECVCTEVMVLYT